MCCVTRHMPGTRTNSLPMNSSMTQGRQSSARPRHGTTILLSLPCSYARMTPCSPSFTRWAPLPPARRPDRSSSWKLSPACWPHASRYIPRPIIWRGRPRTSRPAGKERRVQHLLRLLVLGTRRLSRRCDGLHLLFLRRHDGGARPSLGCRTTFCPSLFALDMPLFVLDMP